MSTHRLMQTLLVCQHVAFTANSQIHPSLCGQGNGRLEAKLTCNHTVDITESGTWQMDAPTKSHTSLPAPLRFTNAYRWAFDHTQQRIDLSHLRYGHDAPVFLLYLVPRSDDIWTTQTEHLCRQDVYSLTVTIQSDQSLSLAWRINGPKKDDAVQSVYSACTQG